MTHAAASEHFERGVHLQLVGEIDGAAHAYKDCIAADPQHAVAHTNLGLLFQQRGLVWQAVALQEIAARLGPSPIIYSNLAVAYDAAHRYDDALAAYAQAFAMGADHPVVLSNYAAALCGVARHAEAIEVLARALAIEPENAEAQRNLGLAYWGVGREDLAVAAYRAAVALAPRCAEYRLQLAFILLGRGEFAEGWAEYEHRWHAENLERRYWLADWDGLRPAPGAGAVLVWNEQGPGDEILQAGMIGDVLDLGCEVVWEVSPRLASLFQRSFPAVRVIERRDRPSLQGAQIAAQIAGLSLGGIVRRSAKEFPARRAYLAADAARVAQLRARLNLTPGERLVGVSWRSENAKYGPRKSCPLTHWGDIAAIGGARLVDLQYGDTAQERAGAGVPLMHFEDIDLRNDFETLAALISLCDVVVTVSNTTAHLAAALGVPTLVLVSEGAARYWYWNVTDAGAPLWYPAARVIRSEDGWPAALDDAFSRVTALLAAPAAA